eukprot:gene8204-7548_t
MVLWGSDFHFHDAHSMFGNMSVLIKEFASDSSYGVSLRYSTAADYFDALHSWADAGGVGAEFPVVQGLDFELGWPHRIAIYNNSLAYQTGVPTSWPNFKRMIRDTGALATAAEQALALAATRTQNGAYFLPNMSLALSVRRTMGLVQHHDAIGGTMRTNQSTNEHFYIGDADVLGDYSEALQTARQDASVMLSHSLCALASNGDASCTAGGAGLSGSVHVPDCMLSRGSGTVLLWNPLSWALERPVTLGHPESVTLELYSAQGEQLPCQPHESLSQGHQTTCLVQLPPLGFAALEVRMLDKPSPVVLRQVPSNMSNGNITAGLAPNGQLLWMESGGVRVSLNHSMAAYRQPLGGAYIMYEEAAATPVDYYAPGSIA